MKRPFIKYSGCGNTFLLFEGTPLPTSTLQHLCLPDVHAVDGVIFWEATTTPPRMHYFNADGGRASLCGNGLRCLFHALFHLKRIGKEASILTDAGLFFGKVQGHQVEVSLPTPELIETNKKFETITYTHMRVGVDHYLVEDPNFCFTTQAPKLRKEGVGANVNWLHGLQIRTFEKGVERETEACGTGCSAFAWWLAHTKKRNYPIHLTTKSGELLTIQERTFNNTPCLSLTGAVLPLFSGEVDCP